MRQVWSDENRTAQYLGHRKGAGRSCRAASASFPQEAADEIARNCDLGKIDMDKLRQQTERIGYPILGVVSQLNALCRDKLGEYCHWGATTQDITDTATVLQIREGLAIVDAELAAISAALGRARPPLSRHADCRPQQPAAGDSDDVRLQDGDDPRRRRAPSRAPRRSCGRGCWWANSAAPAARWRRIEQGAMETQAGLMAELGLGQPAIAWHTVRDTIAEVGAFLGTRRRHARQGGDGHQADDADRSSGGVRAVRARPRFQQHDAAEAQSDLVLLHPCGGVRRSPARRRADGRNDRRSRALDGTVGDRMDRPAGRVLPDRRRAEADPLRARGFGGRHRDACAPTSISPTAS